MKAISLWQPWASLIACGAKQYETRSWSTSYRGRIAIHAAKTLCHRYSCEVDGSIFAPAVNFVLWPGETFSDYACEHDTWEDEIPLGAIIATAELVECWKIQASNGRGVNFKDVYINKPDPRDLDGVTWISGNERLFGDWTPGRYAWELRNVVMLPEPIPAKGAQGLWNWNDGVRDD